MKKKLFKDGGKDREAGFSMKKSKLLVVGLIGLLLAFGLVLAGCGSKCPNDGNCSYSRGSTSANDCKDRCLEKQAQSGEDRNLDCNC